MLSFFRINDPFRILGVLLVLISIRLPFILKTTDDLMLPELGWMVVGEKMSGGVLYKDVWDSISPFSAIVYWLIDLVFGRSQLVYQVLSICLVVAQAFTFNQFLIRLGIYHEKTYIPALLYGLFMCLSIDFFTLPPVLLSLTFLLLVLRNIFRLDGKAVDQEIFKTGLYLGISTLVYLPSIFFLFMTLLGLALFKTSSARYLLLLIYGFLFIILIYGIYLFYAGIAGEFYNLCIESYILGVNIKYMSIIDLFWLGVVPAFLLVLSIIRLRTEGRFVNFQINSQQIMIFWIIVSIPTVFFNHQIAGYQLMVFVPALSFFVSHYLLITKKKWIAELYTILIFTFIIFNCYNSYYGFIPVFDKTSYENEKVISNNFSNQDKSILVIGNDISFYNGNTLATPYLNWELSKVHFENLDHYATILQVLDNLAKEYPETIIDVTDNKVAETLFKRAPQLARIYDETKKSGIQTYERKENFQELLQNN